MKQFSVEEYLKNPTRKIITRDGRNARIICTDMKSTTYPVVALIKDGSGYEQLFTFSKNGEYAVNESSRSDLFFTPEQHEGWINVSREEYGYEGGLIYDSKEDAEKIAKVNKCCIATVKIEWEE